MEETPQPRLKGELPGPPGPPRTAKTFCTSPVWFYFIGMLPATTLGPSWSERVSTFSSQRLPPARRPKSLCLRLVPMNHILLRAHYIYPCTNSVCCQWFYSDILTNQIIRTSRYCTWKFSSLFANSGPRGIPFQADLCRTLIAPESGGCQKLSV